MALSGTTNKVSFTPTAGTTSLTFLIPFFDATTVSVANKKYGDIKVTRTRSGIDLLLTPVTSSPTADQFQLSATNGDPSQGGVITIAASSSGDKFTIERDVEYTQQYDLQEGATIDPTALNKAFDRVVAQNQQQNDSFTRTVEFPVSDDPARTYTVGTETERANKALGFDASGNVTELNLSSTNTVGGNNNKGINLVNSIIEAKVDSVTTTFDVNGNIIVKDSGITTAKLNTDSVTTAKILNDNVTYDKLQDISTFNSVLGNTGTGTVEERALVGDILYNDPTMAFNSSAKGATQSSIKAYVDARQPKFVAIDGTTGSTPLNFVATVRSSFGDEQIWNLSDFTSTGAGNTPTLDISKCTAIHVSITIFVKFQNVGFSAQYPDGNFYEIALDEASGSGDDNRMDFIAIVPINPSLGQTTFNMKCLKNSSQSDDSGSAKIIGATQF